MRLLSRKIFTQDHHNLLYWPMVVFAMLLLFTLSAPAQHVTAQSETGETQALHGRINPEGTDYYELPGRKRGERLYVLMRATTDNLDPFVGLLSAETDLGAWRADLDRELETIGSEIDILQALEMVNDQYFLAWDDDSGPGYAAALTFTVPEDGDYYLVASSSAATLWEPVFGDYELYLGIDEPGVLSGIADGNAEIAFRNVRLSPATIGIQNLAGTLSEEKQFQVLGVTDVQAGDTLYISADLIAESVIALLDFGGKPLAVVLAEDSNTSTILEYTFTEPGDGYSLRLAGCCGDYQMRAGLNAPEVTSGPAADQGVTVLEQAIPVNIGFRLQQITDVDQKAENFSVVGTLRMEWDDPRLAFSRDECLCLTKVFTQRNFGDFTRELDDAWPDFTFFNQQGNRWIQNQELIVIPNGHATYLERFSTTFQAPEFDFRKFPFDSQQFFIHIDSLWSNDIYAFQDDESFTALGTQLGEEEWPVTEFAATVGREKSSTENLTSRYTYSFGAHRDLNFYLMRFFIPILVVIIVSWITFFLKDFDKRVDVAAGNLLLFIAFNFTISNDLPRLGYLTFMDAVLIATFVITALVVVFNVILKRLELGDKGTLAARLDLPMIWLYPLLYLSVIVVTYYYFFVLEA